MTLSKKLNLYNYKAKILRVVDGDTVEARIDLGFKINIDLKVRLANINAPEISTNEGKESKKWLGDNLPLNQEVTLSMFKSQDKYGRYLAVILYNGQNINQELIKSGHATEY